MSNNRSSIVGPLVFVAIALFVIGLLFNNPTRPSSVENVMAGIEEAEEKNLEPYVVFRTQKESYLCEIWSLKLGGVNQYHPLSPESMADFDILEHRLKQKNWQFKDIVLEHTNEKIQVGAPLSPSTYWPRDMKKEDTSSKTQPHRPQPSATSRDRTRRQS